MRLESIKTRQYVIILLIILLMSVGALNIYFYIIVDTSERRLTNIISLEKAFSDILVKEITSLKDAGEYEGLVNTYSALRKTFSSVLTHAEDDVITQRQAWSEKFFFADMEARQLNNSVHRLFSELINSIRYIHEHHIGDLKKIVRHGAGKTDFYGDEDFHKIADRSASEIDIIKVVSAIHTSLFDIELIFDDAENTSDLPGMKAAFSRRMKTLSRMINTFESHSLDAQDGILVEELLRTSREMGASFSALLEIKKNQKVYSTRMDETKARIIRLLAQKNRAVSGAGRRIKKTVGTLQFISLVFVILVGSAIIAFGKKTMDEVQQTVAEARKIQEDFSYKIRVDSDISIEFQIIFNALNTMTFKINSYVQQLRESERKYRLLVENQTDMIVKLDTGGLLNFVSPSLTKTFGRSGKDLLGKPFADLFPGEGQLRIRETLEKVSAPPHHCYMEARAVTAEGERWQAWLHTAVLDEAGQLDAIIAAGRDIHDQKVAEAAIRRLSQAVEASPASVVITDRDGTIKYVNPKFVEVTGFSAEEAVGQNPSILNSGRQPKALYKKMWETISSGREWRGTFCNRKKNGDTYWESAAIAPVSDDHGEITHYVAVKEDITARRRYENNLKEARALAESAARAKGLFLANMSHEIRTPLNAVLGFLDLAMEDPSLPEVHREYLGIAQDSANSLLGVINDILDISKLESGRLTVENRPFDLPGLMGDIRDAMDIITQEKQLDLQLELHPGITGFFMGDAFRLRQVVVNLVNNAIKFTEKGHVRIRVIPGKGPDEIHFTVADTGIGIPDDRLGTLFKPFIQADGTMTRRFGGTGLGTAISKELVELMGGKIWVESREGEGSTFHFVVPLPPAQQDDAPALEEIGHAAAPSGGRRFHILLAEDEAVNVKLLRTRLEKKGHRVSVAENGKKAVAAFEQGAPDIILMDVQMPEMDGLRATEQIRGIESGTGSHIPIIAITAGVTPEETTRCRNAGMDAVVAKPVDFRKLTRIIGAFIPRSAVRATGEHRDRHDQVPGFDLRPIDGVDMDKARQGWQDQAVYIRALVSFVVEYGRAGETLDAHLARGQVQKARQLCHCLKGVAGNLCLTRIAELADGIETCLDRKRTDQAGRAISDIGAAIDTLAKAVDRFKGAELSCDDRPKDVDAGTVAPLFRETLSALDQFNPYAVAPLISRLERHLGGGCLDAVARHIENFDFDSARKEITGLARRLNLNLEE